MDKVTRQCPQTFVEKNNSCIKTGSDESRYNLSIIVWGRVTKTVSKIHSL